MRTQLAQGKGRRGVERALEQLDIDSPSEEAWQLAYEQFGDDELERAMALLHRKPPRSKNLREGAYRKLVQKGYNADVAASAARRWSESLAAPECEYFAD